MSRRSGRRHSSGAQRLGGFPGAEAVAAVHAFACRGQTQAPEAIVHGGFEQTAQAHPGAWTAAVDARANAPGVASMFEGMTAAGRATKNRAVNASIGAKKYTNAKR